MIVFSTKEKEFIKKNRHILKSIFQKELDYIKEHILDIKDEKERDLEIRFGRYLRDWISQLNKLDNLEDESELSQISNYI